jgi:hypothetical protein
LFLLFSERFQGTIASVNQASIQRKDPDSPMHYILFYEVADDYLSRRAEFRNAHLKLAPLKPSRSPSMPRRHVRNICIFTK